MSTADDIRLDKLFEIYRSVPFGSDEEAAALRAIGKIGTPRAIDFLTGVFDAVKDEEAVEAAQTRLVVIEALAEARSS